MVIKDNVCWPSVEDAIAHRLADIHLDLEAAGFDKIMRLQGEAAALRWLLTQAEPPPTPKNTPLD